MSEAGVARSPLIGITARLRALTTSIGERFHFTLMAQYVDAVAEVGGAPIVLPHDESSIQEILRVVDGLLLTGGEDVSPVYFGETLHPSVKRVDPARDRFEIALIRQAIERDTPLLAICRGIQVLNVAAGGSLIQDIGAQVVGPVSHHYIESFEEPSHTVQVAADSKLAQVLGATRLQVNSGHHQAVKAVAPGLRAVAWAEDGLIEAVESPHHRWIIGVQWHPEMMFRKYPQQARLFSALVEACRNGKEVAG